jgi:hypothetical protein
MVSSIIEVGGKCWLMKWLASDCASFIQRFAAQRRAQPQPVDQRGQPVAGLLRLLARQLARNSYTMFDSRRRLLTCCRR